MRLGKLNIPHQIVGQVRIKIKTSITGGKESNPLQRTSQSRWKSQFCKQNKLAKSANFVSNFQAKHAVEEQSQYLEESQNHHKFL